MSIDDHAEIAALVFAAALDPDAWQMAVERMYQVSGGVWAHFFGHDARTCSVLQGIASSYDPEMLSLYDRHYAALNPKLPQIAALVPGGVVRSAELVPMEALHRTEFFADWLRPQGSPCYGAGSVLFRDAERFIFIGGDIPESEADRLETPWCALVKRLVPIMQQALEISRALDGRSLENLSLEGNALSGAATLVVRSDGRILHADAAAEALLVNGELIGRDALGRLIVPCDGGANLGAAVESLAIKDGPALLQIGLRGRNGIAHLARTLRFDPRVLKFSPFGMLCGFSERCLFVAISPLAVPMLPSGLLRRRYAMTEAEAALALALSEGRSLGQIAEARGVSIHTVRAQAKAVLAKTGTHRQADLVRLLAGLPHR